MIGYRVEQSKNYIELCNNVFGIAIVGKVNC